MKGVDRPAGGLIQNELSRSLISQDFLPRSGTNRHLQDALRNKRFSRASGTTADQRARRSRRRCSPPHTRSSCLRPPHPNAHLGILRHARAHRPPLSPRFAICATVSSPTAAARSNCSPPLTTAAGKARKCESGRRTARDVLTTNYRHEESFDQHLLSSATRTTSSAR